MLEKIRGIITKSPIFVVMAVVFLTAAVIRFVYVGSVGLPHADPWRHLTLLRNIRDGLGFTLFDGQPYIWYSPVWYYISAAVTSPENVKWVSAVISMVTVPLFACYLFKIWDDNWRAALFGGFLMAAFGPMVVFTSQLGSEAFAMFLLVTALLTMSYRRGSFSGLCGGIMFGLSLAARLQFVFNAIMFLPLLKKPRSGAWFLLGTSIPLALHWWRNYLVLRGNVFVFTWDGLATPSRDYNLISTLAVQIHPAVIKATHMLYERIIPHPEWLYSHGRLRWEIMFFGLVSIGCVVLSRKMWLISAAIITVAYFLIFDDTLSSRFFRIWLGLFPALFIGIAGVMSQLVESVHLHRWALVGILLLLMAATGFPDLKRDKMFSIEMVTPPHRMLTGTHYMVNSGFYHPESLIYRYPSKKFIGMPMLPDQFDHFRKEFPGYRLMIWHGFNVQTELFEYVKRSDSYSIVQKGANMWGYPYFIVEEQG